VLGIIWLAVFYFFSCGFYPTFRRKSFRPNRGFLPRNGKMPRPINFWISVLVELLICARYHFDEGGNPWAIGIVYGKIPFLFVFL